MAICGRGWLRRRAIAIAETSYDYVGWGTRFSKRAVGLDGNPTLNRRRTKKCRRPCWERCLGAYTSEYFIQKIDALRVLWVEVMALLQLAGSCGCGPNLSNLAVRTLPAHSCVQCLGRCYPMLSWFNNCIVSQHFPELAIQTTTQFSFKPDMTK